MKPITEMKRTPNGRSASIHIRLMYGPHLRGCLLQLSNGRWGIYSADEQKLSTLTFQQPAMARDKFDELFPNDVPA